MNNLDDPLDELYLTWLYSQVGSVKQNQPSRTYWSLLRQLYKKEFVWVIPNDGNRVEDGRKLRFEFIDDQEIDNVDHEWINLGCSMFEMMIGLSRRLSFEAERSPRVWFWELIENLDLYSYNDENGVPHRRVDTILNRVIFRTYRRDGKGGLFPLIRTDIDQRNVEIWYQMSSYIFEMEDT